ncbi:acyl-CoA dehydrogenase family protein [bacterium]|nr:acyl-CoA dehydrogenase family protein [bacterium]MBU1677076.1 acyl-CoA dehydrogenase family protein [bacterium]
MQTFNGIDYYRFEEGFNDEERAVRDTVREFVSRRFLPLVRRHHEAGTFPMELVPEMAEMGLLGPSIHGPGCLGLSATIYGIICQELERGDSGLRSFASVQGSLVMWPIATYGSAAQKSRWLPELAAGRAVGCFGLTEAGHGSDPGGMETTATPDGDGWILNGAKMWITNANLADLAVVWARGPDGVLGFLVERDSAGFHAAPVRGKFSLRASDTGELAFDEVRLPDASRLPDARGLRAPLSCLNQARYGIAWGAVGAAADCYETALRYALAREQFSRPLASFQLVQRKLVRMLTEITKAQALVHQLGRLKDRGIDEVPLVSLAKRNNVAMALDCARTARDVLGAAGITDEFPVGRHMTNLESVKTYEGTHDIHTLIVGADITGLSAFR